MAWAERMGSGRWRGRYYDQEGNPHSVIDGNVGFEKKKDAVEAAENEAVKARRKAAVASGTQSARILWGDLRELFAATRRDDTDTESTDRYVVDGHVYPKWGKVPINEINRKKIQSWIDKEVKPGKKPRYVRRIYEVFSAPINWAVEEEILDVSPCTKIKLPTITDEPKPYMDDEYLAMLRKHVNRLTMLAVEFQYETGLRPGELGGLHIHRIDRKLRILHVADVLVARQKVIRPFTKNEKVDEIPLTARALEILDEVLDGRDRKRGCGLPHTNGRPCPSDVVFRTVQDVPLNPRNYYMLLFTAAESGGFELRSPYAGRRGTATRVAEAGLGIFDIAALLRHDPSQTAGYVQKTPAFYDRVRVALGDSPQLTVVEGRGARGAPRGAEPEKQPSSAVVSDDEESAG